MINIPNKLLKEVQEGLKTQKDIESFLMDNYSINQILEGFAELIIIAEETVNKPQITVSEEEFQQITSLFKIKGLREINGIVCEERRGRPKKEKILKA